MAKLTFVLEDGQQIAVPLAEHITLGREDDNDVVIDDDRVSKHHAELVRNADGSIQLFDSNSTAGTFVNGERVRSHTILHGDQLAFGPLTAVLDLEENAANGSTSTPPPAGSDTQPLTSGRPVQPGKIATRKKKRATRRDLPPHQQPALPRQEFSSPQMAEKRESSRLALEKVRLQAELEAMQKTWLDWRQQAELERAMHHSRVEALRAEEKRLGSVKAARAQAEAAEVECLVSLQALATRHKEQSAALQALHAEHAQKTADLQVLAIADAAARSELEGLAAHRDQALAHLQQIRADAVRDEKTLDALRQQVAGLEARSQQIKEVIEVREDQLKTAEKKLDHLSQHRAQLEVRIHELSETEAKLAQTAARCHEAEEKQSALTAAITTLEAERQRSAATLKDLSSQVAELRASFERDTTAAAAALGSRREAEQSLRRLQGEIAAQQKELSTATQRLQQTSAKHAELDRQCQELADTGEKLAELKQQHAEAAAAIASATSQIADQQSALKTLAGEESAARGRIEVLRAREQDLRAELTQLSAAERTQRIRFEEVRQLAAEAEKEHAAQQQQLAASLESSRIELQDLVSTLTPLRDWKEAMDLLYARLAALPQDSAEARHLWHEIEKEKAGLHELIVTARAQAQVASPVASHTNALSQIIGGRSGGSQASRAGGAMRETTLRSRHRANPAADAILREQSRHLETKIRQEQERHHALLRHIELAQIEEEKRHQRLGELEHRLAELRTDIIEAERLRSELRQQADLAHAELKNYEAAIDRVTKITTD